MVDPACRPVRTVLEWRKSFCRGRYLWPEVHIMKSTTFAAIITCMKITHGMPHEIVNDNGSQFISTEFSTYLSKCGIIHRKVTPY